MPVVRAPQPPEPQGEPQAHAGESQCIDIDPPQPFGPEAVAPPAARNSLPEGEPQASAADFNCMAMGPPQPADNGAGAQPAARNSRPEGEPQASAADSHCIAMGPPQPADNGAGAQPAAHNFLLVDDNRGIIRNNITDNMGFWAKAIVAFCFGSAIQIALLSVQPQTTPQGRLPLTLHLVSLSVLLAFTSFVVSKFIDSNRFASAVRMLEGVGFFFGVTAFFMAITVPFPFHMKCITWTLYVVSVLAVLVCNALSA